MKGTIFIKPLEYNLEAIGEKWRQGDKIKGSLKIKNHSVEKIEMPSLIVALGEGQYKKIKEKDHKGWKFLNKVTLAENFLLVGQEEIEHPFEFILPEDCLITDKAGSLYLAFFDKDEAWPSGHIELAIAPKQVINQILEIFENFLRFKVAQIKSGKGAVEVKLNPPAGREFSTMDSLVLSIVEINKKLTLSYLFNVRALDMSSGAMQTQKKTKKIEQEFNSSQYLFYGESLNQDFILASINSVLAEVKPKLM